MISSRRHSYMMLMDMLLIERKHKYDNYVMTAFTKMMRSTDFCHDP